MKKHMPLLIILFIFIQRLIYSIIIHPPEKFFHSDMMIYGAIANSILRGEWLVSHFFQPIGFPLIVAGIKLFASHWTYWLAIIHAIAGALTAFFISRAVRKFWGERTELLTLVLCFFHVPWIIYTGYAMPETLYTLALSILLWASVNIIQQEKKTLNSVIWGVSFIIGFWIKGQHAFLLPLFLGGLLYYSRKNLKPVLIMGTIVMLGMGAHWGWSYAKVGTGKFSADTGGLNFVEGKCPSKKNTDPVTNITWWSPLYHNLHMDAHKRWDQPFSNSSYYMKEGMKCIARNPWVMVQSLESVPFLFFGNSLWPANWQPFGEKVRLYELMFVFFAIPGLLIFFLYAAMHQKLAEILIWGMPILALFICVYIFKSEIRYRIPFDVFIIPMAIRGWEKIMLAIRAMGHQYDHKLRQGSPVSM